MPTALRQLHKKRVAATLVGLVVALLVLMLFSFNIGRYWIDLEKIVTIMAGQVLPLEPTWSEKEASVVLGIRFPRIAAAILVGGALSLAGAAYQAVFKNPLVSSDILGASSGSSLGAAIAIFTGMHGAWIPAMAFAFGMAAVGTATTVGKFIRKEPTLTLILAGILVGSLCNALVSLIKFVADPRDVLPSITYWLLGSLANIKMTDLALVSIPIVLSAIPIIMLGWRINILSMGDDEAKALGIETEKLRRIVIVCATILTSSAISVCGLIGWVGLVIPHLVRMMIGSDNRAVLPGSVLGGALFLLLVDDLARSLVTVELPLGILTAVIGAPFFIALMVRDGRKAQ